MYNTIPNHPTSLIYQPTPILSLTPHSPHTKPFRPPPSPCSTLTEKPLVCTHRRTPRMPTPNSTTIHTPPHPSTTTKTAPLTLLPIPLPLPRISFTPAYHIKLTAESMAAVLFAVGRGVWAWIWGCWGGWKEGVGKKGQNGERGRTKGRKAMGRRGQKNEENEKRNRKKVGVKVQGPLRGKSASGGGKWGRRCGNCHTNTRQSRDVVVSVTVRLGRV